MDEVLSLLDRQVAALRTQVSSAEFLVSVEPTLQALEAEPRLAVHLADLRDEVIEQIQVFARVDDELVPVLVELRNRLVVLDPASDDSDRQPAVYPKIDPSWSITLAYFDTVAARSPEPLNYRGEGTRSEQLLGILQNKANVVAQRFEQARSGAFPSSGTPALPPEAEWDEWTVGLYNADARWNHESRRLQLSMRVSAGLALLRLEQVPVALNPEPRMRVVGEDRHARAERIFREFLSSNRTLYDMVHDNPPRDETRSAGDAMVAEIRAGLSRLHTEPHRRVGMTRSRRALITRFRQRAEWHDAARLRAVADDGAISGGPEDRLTAELARYLFDEGLNPITKPQIGGLEPDLLDASLRPAFYVEAKQYKRADRQGLIKALGQILDTIGRLQSDAYPASEAFCVVFRRGGPRYLLPDSVQAEGYRVYFTLVDIAPTDVSGRRQRHRPSWISKQELIDAAPPPEDT